MKYQPDIPPQKLIMEAFNQRIDVLINEIRRVNDENTDPQMVSIKTKRLIDKWFKHGGKIPRV